MCGETRRGRKWRTGEILGFVVVCVRSESSFRVPPCHPELAGSSASGRQWRPERGVTFRSTTHEVLSVLLPSHLRREKRKKEKKEK